MKQRRTRLVAFLLAAIMLTGCGGSTQKEANAEETKKVLNWNVNVEPEALDPMLMSTYGMQIVNNTFEGLMRTYDGELIYGLAEKYEISEDETTYTFYLRDDAKWSDGEPITADDFIFAWTRMIDPELKNYYGQQFFYIKNAQKYYNGECSIEEVGFKAIDEKTIEVQLLAPTPFFLSLTAFNIYYPVREDVVDDEGVWSRDPETYVCDGPFTLGEYKANESITLVKNENYWNADAVNLDEIYITFIADESSAMSAYRTGDVDVFSGVSSQDVTTLAAEDDEFYMLPTLAVEYYYFNLEKEVFSDVRVRQAFNMAIDRTALVENVTKSGEVATDGVVTNEMYLSTGEEFRDATEEYFIDTTKAKVEEAQKLLEEAGYPGGEGFPEITLTYNTGGLRQSVAEAIQQMWKENLGIDVSLVAVEGTVIGTIRNNGEFDIVRHGWSADYPDPMTYLSVFENGSHNSRFSDAEYDECITTANSVVGTERDEALLRAEQILIDEESVVIPLYQTVDTCMVRSSISGWDKTGYNGWFFGFADITE